MLRGEDANLLSVGRARFRHHRRCRRHPGREHLSEFPVAAGGKGKRCCATSPKNVGRRSDARQRSRRRPGWTDRLRLILISALQIDRAVFFSTAIIVAAFIPLFTMQGVEGQIFSPMARTYAYALVGALIATFTVTPCLASLLLAEHVSEVETGSSCGGCARSTRRCCNGRCATGTSRSPSD